jgi:hypothetical protein
MVSDASIKARRDAVAPLFAILDTQGQRNTWLAEKLGISKTALWNYKRGLRAMPQSLFDLACDILKAPPIIARTIIPAPQRPGPRQKNGKGA